MREAPSLKTIEFSVERSICDTESRLKVSPWQSKQLCIDNICSFPLIIVTNLAVPIPCIGIVPATPITRIAQGRIVQKASEQELMDCPAPESTYHDISQGREGRGPRSHSSVSFRLAAAVLTRRILEGRRSAGTFDG